MTTATQNAHDLIVIQLSGGNDYLNTVVPYGDPLYHQFRPTLGLSPDKILPLSFDNQGRTDLQQAAVIPLDNRIGLHGALAPLKPLFDAGKMAVFLGIGYPNPNRSHFRSMDIWHTAEPDEVSNEGWLGKTANLLDPAHKNPVLVANMGRAAPLALAYPGVMAASLDALDTYGVFPDVAGDPDQYASLATAARCIYEAEPAVAPWQSAQRIGLNALDGIEMLRSALNTYRPSVEYMSFNPLAQHLRTIAQIKSANLGTRIYYANHGGYDTHNDQLPTQQRLLEHLGKAIVSFLADLDAQESDNDTVVLVFSEFGRRIAENGGGTDHGGAGVAFLIGNNVRGGIYGEYPSLRPEDQIEGDVRPNLDFREVYGAILDQFVRVDSHEVIGRATHPLQLRKAG